MRYFFVFLIFFIFGFAATPVIRATSPKVSVVMSTHNRADLLPRAIDSILGQSFHNFEFIIVDDGSTDNTADILKAYEQKDPRIIVLKNNKNAGLVASLNRGIDAAKGKYIARMDDDDISLPDRFKKQVAFMEKHPKIAVTGCFVEEISSGKRSSFPRATDPDMMYIFAYFSVTPISHSAAMIRRSFLNAHHIRYRSEYKSAEDKVLWWEIQEAGGLISNVPEYLAKFRHHYTNPSSYYREQSQNVSKFQKKILAEMIGKPVDSLTPCERYTLLSDANRTKKKLNQEKLDIFIRRKCPKPTP